jgi:hypothetical protein
MDIVKNWIALALLPLAFLMGCATTDAPPDMQSPVYQRTPTQREELDATQARERARWAVPFARVASQVYCGYLQSDDPQQARKESCDRLKELAATGWAALYDSHTVSVLSPEELSSGLEFMAFGRLLESSVDGQGEIIIGFRGTDLTSLGDWRANLRWITRFLPLPGKDQYEIVHAHAGRLIDRAEAEARKRFPAAKGFDVYTAGHSLGGGLAQLLAYSDIRVKGAVVFDPSPVTGYSTVVSDKQVNCSARVMRIYERGEGLSYLRSFLRRFYSISDNINEVSFDFIHTGGNPFANHSMVKFREGLEAKGGVAEGTSVRATALPGGPDCDCYRLRLPEVRGADAGQCSAPAP